MWTGSWCEQRLSGYGHFMQRECLDGTLGCLHVSCQVWCIHVGLPELARFPVFVKHKIRRVGVVLMEVILNTTRFATRDRDQFFKLIFDQSSLCGIRLDVGNNVERIRKLRRSRPVKNFSAGSLF
jgi:hypothetical protein